MSIDGSKHTCFTLTCDHCEDAVDEIFDDFQGAVQYKKDNAWKSVKDTNDDWNDLCPSCQSPEIIRALKGVE